MDRLTDSTAHRQPLVGSYDAGRARRRPVLATVAALGVLPLLLSACGGGGSGSASAASSSAQPSGAPSGAPGANGPRGTSGTVAQVTPTQIQVQNQSIGQVAVNYTKSTKITKTVATTRAHIIVGSCVVVTPPQPTSTARPSNPPSSRPTVVTAGTVQVSTPTNGTCGGGFGGGFRGGSGVPSEVPTQRPSNRPSGGFGGGSGGGFGAFGKVTAVSAGGFTVERTVPGNGTGSGTGAAASSTVTVTTTATTKYQTTVATTSASLAVGQCVTAVGPSDTTGAVTARSIAIRASSGQSCDTAGRFGGFRGPGFPGGMGAQGGAPGDGSSANG